jgi:hypothetical protein
VWWTNKHYIQGSLFISSKEVDLEVNAEITVFEDSGQSYNLKIDDITLENVFMFICLGTNERQVYEQITSVECLVPFI